MQKRKPDAEPVETLDPQTLEALDKGIQASMNGRRWTLAQAVDFARKRREEWKQIPDDLTA